MKTYFKLHRRKIIVIRNVFVAGAFIWYKVSNDADEKDFSNVIELNVGLTNSESHHYRTLSQRNSVIPAGLLDALEYERGVSMRDRLLTHGFLLGGGNRDLPIGFGLDKEKHLGLDISKISINCAACHTGELHYNNKKFRIDGAPNMVDIEAWSLELADVVERTLSSEEELVSTAKRFFEYSVRWALLDMEESLGSHSLKARKDLLLLVGSLSELEVSNEEIRFSLGRGAFPFSGFENGNSQGIALQMYTSKNLIEKSDVKGTNKDTLNEVEVSYLGEEIDGNSQYTFKWTSRLMDELRKLQRGATKKTRKLQREAIKANGIVTMVRSSPRVGPGRDDAWNLIDKVILNESGALLDTPVSIPHLFGISRYKFYHCDGNTNSMMSRNIAQAIALGADVDPDTNVASLSPKMVHKANTLARDIEPPKWPVAFGEINEDLKKRGEELYHAKNYYNYKSFDVNGQALAVKAMGCADCHQNPAIREDMVFYQIGTSNRRLGHYNSHGDLLQKVVKNLVKIEKKTMDAYDISLETAASWEPNGMPEWKNNKGYVARPLAGVWASAPYLHNGSVRTMEQLFLPASQRESSFRSGTREFDPAHLGFESGGDYVLDVTRIGNSNAGHEFGTELGIEDRKALIEYIKSL